MEKTCKFGQKSTTHTTRVFTSGYLGLKWGRKTRVFGYPGYLGLITNTESLSTLHYEWSIKTSFIMLQSMKFLIPIHILQFWSMVIGYVNKFFIEVKSMLQQRNKKVQYAWNLNLYMKNEDMLYHKTNNSRIKTCICARIYFSIIFKNIQWYSGLQI